MYKIAIIESESIIREGLCALLSKESDFTVDFQASAPAALFRQAWISPPNLILLDMMMPKNYGIDVIKEIKRRWQATKILIFTLKDTEENICDAFRAGADGYILKGTTLPQLIEAMKNILAGQYYVCPDILPQIINSYLKLENTPQENNSNWNLTGRESQLLKLIAAGYKNKEIADSLCISVKTVETHRATLMKKFNAHNVATLLSVAKQASVNPCRLCKTFVVDTSSNFLVRNHGLSQERG
ncbi:MAG: response regulator transcription factor [Methylobacter sp.]|nr:response regulator transcription factor [Methylobacter sp.]